MDNFNINNSIAYNVLIRSHYNDIINYCRTHTMAYTLLDNKCFWTGKSKLDFNISPQLFIDTDLTTRQRYLELLTNNDGIAIGSENYISMKECMKRAIKQNKEDVVEYLLRLGYNDYDKIINCYSCEGSLLNIEKYLPLSETCFVYQNIVEKLLKNGHMEISKKIIERLANNTFVFDYKKLLISAIKSGNKDIFNYILSLNDNICDWETIIYHSVASGNVQFFINLLGICPILIVWEDLLDVAAKNQNSKLFHIISENARHNGYIGNLKQEILWTIMIKNNNYFNNIIKDFNCRFDYYDVSWYDILIYTIKYDKHRFIERFNLMINSKDNPLRNIKFINGKLIFNENSYVYEAGYCLMELHCDKLTEILQCSLSIGDIDLFNIILNRIYKFFNNIGDNFICNLNCLGVYLKWDRLLCSGFQYGSKRLINYILKMGPENYNWDWRTLLRCDLFNNDINILYYVLNLVSDSYEINLVNIINKVKSREIFIYLHNIITRTSDSNDINYEFIARKAILDGNNKLIHSILEITSGENWDWEKLLSCAKASNNNDIKDYIVAVKMTK